MKSFEEDIILAEKVRENAYIPYTKYKVGAVLKTKNGRKYTGCNIQNHGIQSICSERVAFCKAISEGETEFESILVIGGKDGEKPDKCLPCGYCRQFMSEFVDKDFKVYTAFDDKVEEYNFSELLPHTFEL